MHACNNPYLQRFLGMLQAVALEQLQLRCCTVGAVQVIREAETGFQAQLLTLWCLHLSSLLHTGEAQSPKSHMVPFNDWCGAQPLTQSRAAV